MNWKGYGRKSWFLNLKYFSGICLEGVRKISINTIRIAGLKAEI
jgi:hypothetical protein